MEVRLIADPGYDANMYLVMSGTSILIDTGTGLSPEECVNSLSEFIDPKDIDRIILTHRHIDHVGGAKALSEACDATLYASEDEAPSLRSGDQVTTAARMFGKNLDKLDVESIGYGDVIEIGAEGLRVIHTPGHTKGSICLYEEGTKSLLCGDTVFAYGGVGRWDFPTGNLQELVESVKGLTEIPVENLYPGHGPVVQGNAHKHIQASYRSLKVYTLV
ncbi:MAG: MBL fold metallo-hydrolase [Thermoplasmata archaeon]|nr:MBL fold metallo-hydrolase [Thermoplasmata archaeon]